MMPGPSFSPERFAKWFYALIASNVPRRWLWRTPWGRKVLRKGKQPYTEVHHG
jgi:hypothetical protein